jgi:hypothetical protein
MFDQIQVSAIKQSPNAPYVHYVEQLWKAASAATRGHYAEHVLQSQQSEHAAHYH